ncbi:MAG TPA: ABC transporter ATP-binding protein [Candidatus Cybelea sp.]
MLSTSGLCFRYANAARPALDRVSLEIPNATTLAVVGPSGAGKTTLLRVIAGLLRAQSGDVRLDDESIADRPPQGRRIALVAQDDALFAHMSVFENLRFALRRRDTSDARIRTVAETLHVQSKLGRRPRQLSGGERQRASIARALLSDPAALLLDEPLAHVDPSLRRSVRDAVIGVAQSFAGPILYVTHDHVEAMSIGDRLAVLVDGRVEDAGEPQRVFDAPRTLGVARFLGERPMNLFEQDGTVVGIRPERIAVLENGGLAGRVMRRESAGADAYLEVETTRGRLTVRVPAASGLHAGDGVALDLPADALRRFDRTTGLALT